MHVLIFYQYFATNDVAGSTRPYEIGRRLVEGGDTVTVVTGNWCYATGRRTAACGLLSKHSQVDGLNIITVRVPFGGSRKILPRIIGFFWFIPFGFLAALSARKPDVVVGSSTPLTIGIPAYLISRIRNVPFIFELRDLWPDNVAEWNVIKSRFMIGAAHWLESFLYRKAAFLITVTEGIRKELIKKGIPAERVKTITTASNLSLFTPEGPRADLRTLAHIPDDAFVCMHTGSIGLANSLGLVLDIAERVLDDPSIHFVLMGNGEQKAGLISEAARRNLRNVHFLNPVPKAAVPSFLRRADLGIVFVKASRLTYIFLPNKFFDCLACGCPVIVNFEGEARDYVVPANAGLFVSSENVDALAAAIRNLAADRDKAQQMRIAARRVAERHFSWDFKAADYREITSAVLAESAVNPKVKGWGTRLVKRAFDVIAAAAGLIVLAIPMAFIAAMVKMSSPGPVFFRQVRPGLHCRSFTLIKFRTMSDAKDSRGNPLPDGDRLTGLGRFLRRTSLDELPELWNVLKGDMSLVGPRPLLVRYLPYYAERERLRHSVRPGLTGWAQVNGRNSVSWNERLGFDVWYVENRSMLLDLRILFRTLSCVLRSDGVLVNTEEGETALDVERSRAGISRATFDPRGVETVSSSGSDVVNRRG